MKVSKIRGIVALVLVVGFTVVGLALQTGTGTLSAMGIGSIASICPVGALESMLGARGIGIHGAICLGLTLIIVILVGKAFCSWACPVPWLQRFFRPGRGKTDVSAPEADDMDLAKSERADAMTTSGCGTCARACAKKLDPIGGKRDGMQLDSRHAILGTALLSSLVFGFPVFCLVCPVGLSFASLIAIWHLFQFNETTWGILIFPAILVLEIVFLRKWCFRFCPISAFLSLVSRFNPTLKPKVDEDLCLRSHGVECHTCTDVCPEQLDPHSKVIPDCSKCHLCAEACPAHAITFPVICRR